jgi:hypothetical protein
MIDELYSTLTTLTEEAETAALQRCKDLSFDTNRGVVSLEESFVNLNSARDILIDAIETRKLIQLPITVQTVLRDNLADISRGLTSLVGGSDEVANLAAAIERLNTSVWQYGLHNLSQEVLGYQTKLNQLKNQELQIQQLRGELEAGLSVKTALEGIVADSSESLTQVKGHAETTTRLEGEISQHLEAAIQNDQKASAALASIQQSESNSTQLLASTARSNADVLALQPHITDFFNQISENRASMSTIVADAETAIKTNKEETNRLIAELQKLEDEIKMQIQKATGFSLFHSFQTRQEALRHSKNWWIGALVIFVVHPSELDTWGQV